MKPKTDLVAVEIQRLIDILCTCFSNTFSLTLLCLPCGFICSRLEYSPKTTDKVVFSQVKLDMFIFNIYCALLQQGNRDFNRPRSDSSYDSAFDDRSSRVSNKSLDDDVDNMTRPDGPQLDETTKRYDSQEARIQQMVDAFRPIIEEIIRVTEVLPYLLFLGNTYYCIRMKERRHLYDRWKYKA